MCFGVSLTWDPHKEDLHNPVGTFYELGKRNWLLKRMLTCPVPKDAGFVLHASDTRPSDMDTPMRQSAKEVHSLGALYPGSPVRILAPSSFFDPLSGCLMTEPVKLVNTNETFDRTSLQTWYRKSLEDGEPKCPRTGQPLKGWIVFEADHELQKRIVAWADKHKCNLDLISKMKASQRGSQPAGLLVDPYSPSAQAWDLSAGHSKGCEACTTILERQWLSCPALPRTPSSRT